MNPLPPKVSRTDSAVPRCPRAGSPFKRAGLSAVLALFTTCTLLCAPAAAAGVAGAAKKRSPKPTAAAKAGKSEEAKPAPKQMKPEHIGIEHEESAYPSDGALKKFKLVVRHKAGDKLFEPDPNLISLSISPAGASDLIVRLVTPTRIEADFWAPEDFKVGEVSVSVYDRDNPQLVAASSDVEQPLEAEKPDAAKGGKAKAEAAAAKGGAAAADAQPKINSTDIIFLQRAYGIGRMKIEGENFGNYKAPPISAEDYLLCYEPLAQQALVEALASNPRAREQRKLEDQRCDELKVADPARLARWVEWRRGVEESVKVALVPRNTDLRIEQAKVLYIDDKLIDVYFEFNRYYRHSEPFRLASTTVTVRKGDAPQGDARPDAKAGAQTAAGSLGVGDAVVMNASVGDGVKPAVKGTEKFDIKDGRKTYITTKEVGTRQDSNLEYRYTVLDEKSAATLFGRGVADNFYAIQLSVTNKGDKKVSIPLASIQAEVEWAYGETDKQDKKNDGGKSGEQEVAASSQPARRGTDAAETLIPTLHPKLRDYYEEGPATLAPLPLPAVTAFFDGDMKVNGKKAKFFNITDGLTVLGSSLIPFFGPGFRDAHVAFTGGLVPGIRRGVGDLSGQQLQNLTALSWQGVEVVAAKGGSLEKFVFIQRGDQVFSPGFGERLRKTIKNIEGMEVVGFEVQESDAMRAAPADQQ